MNSSWKETNYGLVLLVLTYKNSCYKSFKIYSQGLEFKKYMVDIPQKLLS